MFTLNATERRLLIQGLLSFRSKVIARGIDTIDIDRILEKLIKQHIFPNARGLSHTGPLLRELIDHIDVYEQEGSGKNKRQRLVIFYKFIGYFDIGGIIKANYTADLREGVAVEYVTCEPTTNQYDLYQGRIKEQHRAAQ